MKVYFTMRDYIILPYEVSFSESNKRLFPL